MDNLARDGEILERIERSGAAEGMRARKMNPEQDEAYWLSLDSPKPKLENEKPQGETVDYDLLLRKAWREGRVK